MKSLLVLTALTVASVAHADPTSIAATVEPLELTAMWRVTSETNAEPIGIRIDRADPVLAKLKLATGDVIRAVNGRTARRFGGFGFMGQAMGTVLYLDVARGTQTFSLRVTLKQPPVEELTMDRQAIEQGGKDFRTPHLLLEPVTRAGKPAGVALAMQWHRSFQEGDILRSIDGKAVTTNDQVADAFDAAKAKPSLLVKLDRLDQPVTVKITVEAPTPEVDEIEAFLEKGIKKVDDTHYTIEKSLVEKVLANPMALAKGARIVPAVKDGKPQGFKLYAIRPSSVYARLGLANGDTLVRINGMDLTTAEKALEVYTTIREAKALVIEIVRLGKPLTLTYTIR